MEFVSFQHPFIISLLLALFITALFTRSFFWKRLLLYKFRQIETFLRDSEEVFYATPDHPAMIAPFALTLKKWQKDFYLIQQFFLKCASQITEKGSEENLLYFQSMKESLADCNRQVQQLIRDSQHEEAVNDRHLGQLRKSFFRFSNDFNRFNESFSH